MIEKRDKPLDVEGKQGERRWGGGAEGPGIWFGNMLDRKSSPGSRQAREGV